VDVGSATADYTGDGTRWYAEQTVENQFSYYQVGGTVRTTGHMIAGTIDDWLYMNQREGIQSYYVWLSVGADSLTVDVEFHLAEIVSQVDPGERVFDILLEPGTPNEVALRNVDVAQAVGHDAAYVLTGRVTVQDYALDIAFQGVHGQPILNGIKFVGKWGRGQRQKIVYVGGSADDTWVMGTDNWWPAEQLSLGGAGQHHVGLRFPEVQIPRGASINGARLWVTPSEATYAPLDVTAYAESVDAATAYDTGALVPARSRTGNGVHWYVSSSTQWLEGQAVAPPDLARVLQEVVNRRGWQCGNDLSLLLIADQGGAPGVRRLWAIDGAMEHRAYLVVEYTPKSATWGTQAVLPLILR
jgi:hypothetical protein